MQYKSDKKIEDLIGKALPILPRIIERDNNSHDQNRKGQIKLSHKPFINEFQNWL